MSDLTEYYIEEETTYVVTYKVTATSRENALDLFESGEAVIIDNFDSTSIDVWEA